jgi:hypothetical protein
MELVAQIDPESQITLGQLAELWGEPVARISDAIDAVKVCNGEPSYIALPQAPGDDTTGGTPATTPAARDACPGRGTTTEAGHG